MAITPVALTRTWYSLGNVPYTYSGASRWGGAVDVGKMWAWLLKNLLLGVDVGGDAKVGTTRNPGSLWTVRYSCDSVTAGVAGDGVDKWVTPDNVVQGNATAAHSWIVLRSPETWGPNNNQFCEMLINYAPASTSTASTTARFGTIYYSFGTAFSGGTTTSRPTSAVEFSGAVVLNYTNLYYHAFWLDMTYTHIRYANFSVDDKGHWFYFGKRQTATTLDYNHCLLEAINTVAEDLTPVHSGMLWDRYGGTNCRTWANTARAMYTSTTVLITSGGWVNWLFGHSINATAMNSVNGSSSGDRIISPNALGNSSTFGRNLFTTAADELLCLPVYICDFGPGSEAAPITNRPQWRGQLPDLWATTGYSFANYASYPNTASQEFVLLANTDSAGGSNWLVPMSVPLLT